MSNVLNQVSIRTVKQDICQQRYDWLSNYTGIIMAVTDNMFCAGLLDVGGQYILLLIVFYFAGLWI